MAIRRGEDSTRQWAQLWALRAITFSREEEVDVPPSPRVLRFVGVKCDRNLPDAEVEKLIDRRLEEMECAELPRRGVLFDNLAMLRDEFGLSAAQAEVIALRALSSREVGLESAMDLCFIGQRGTIDDLLHLLKDILGVDDSDVRYMLDPKGVMVSNGLLRISSKLGSFRERIGLTVGLIDSMHRRHEDIDSLLDFALQQAGEGSLVPADFEHLAPQLELATAIIREGQIGKRPGTGILLHGRPGVGKTEMAKLIARECGLPLYVVENCLGTDNRRERLSRLHFLQGLCRGKRKALVLFDEAEDVWPQKAGPGGAGTDHADKGLVVELLETLKVPVIWATNVVYQIDPAFLRRFDLVLEVTPPPRRVRAKMLRESLPGIECRKGWAEQMVEAPSVTPGVITRYATALRISGLAKGATGARHFESMIGEWLRARGRDLPVRCQRGLDFDPVLANTTMDLEELAKRVVAKGRGRLLLHGLPGTGKTEFAHYLARVGDLPVTLKRGSDLRTKYWGETEQNLAAMFDEARRERSVLVLDEADSFLRDRASARYSWEKSEVNELLTRMEDFEGIFLCATNLMEDIDRAAMRRFHFKIEFRAMALEQRCRMLQQLVGLGAGESIPAEIQQVLEGMEELTAGDFAAVTAGLEILGLEFTTEVILNGLREEVDTRGKKSAGIGFLRAA